MSSYYKHFGYVQAFLSKGKKAKSWRLLKDNKCMCKNTYPQARLLERSRLNITQWFTLHSRLTLADSAVWIRSLWKSGILSLRQVTSTKSIWSEQTPFWLAIGIISWPVRMLESASCCWTFTWQINTGTYRGTRTGKDQTPHSTRIKRQSMFEWRNRN